MNKVLALEQTTHAHRFAGLTLGDNVESESMLLIRFAGALNDKFHCIFISMNMPVTDKRQPIGIINKLQDKVSVADGNFSDNQSLCSK